MNFVEKKACNDLLREIKRLNHGRTIDHLLVAAMMGVYKYSKMPEGCEKCSCPIGEECSYTIPTPEDCGYSR